ncbi:hypothetical protein HEK616_59760 [Streptomyces nigrescens]|uniref:Uncharacterized protein n=1 Tax=Streptomyces nigrescens TaxID=1920 RepID=A0ABM8A1G3_STRNI|nr:hypothetical protein HEK616_59760 [Streptomyces nigrescens]
MIDGEEASLLVDGEQSIGVGAAEGKQFDAQRLTQPGKRAVGVPAETGIHCASRGGHLQPGHRGPESQSVKLANALFCGRKEHPSPRAGPRDRA